MNERKDRHVERKESKIRVKCLKKEDDGKEERKNYERT